jgi:hypothetical protein
MTLPVYVQESFQFRLDDGGISDSPTTGATYIGSVGDDYTTGTGTGNTFRLRFVVQNTAAKIVNNVVFMLKYDKNTAADYTTVSTTSNNIRLVNDGNSIADHQTTVQHIGDGTYVVGDSEGFNDGQTDDETGLIDFAGNDETEVECCLYVVDADVADNDTIDLEIYRTGNNALDTYTDIPRVTVSKAAAGVPTQAMYYQRMRK